MLGLTRREKNYALYNALEDFSPGLLEKAIRKGGDVNGAWGRTKAPLFKAVAIYNAETAEQAVEILLRHKADPEARNENKQTVLHAALDNTYTGLPVLRRLLDAGAEVSAVDKYGNTPLFVALTRKAWPSAEMLVQYGGHAVHTNFQGRTLLMRAMENEAPLELAAKLVVDGMDVNATGGRDGTALAIAIARGNKGYIELLLKQPGINLELGTEENTPLMMAVIAGRRDLVALLLKAGAQVDVSGAEGITPLVYAANAGHNEIVDQLVAAGATLDRPNRTAWTALSAAANNGNIRMVMSLLAAALEQDIKHNLEPALQAAAAKGHGRVLELLISAGGDVNAKDVAGRTPLMNAAFGDHVEALDILIRAGAKLDTADGHGMSAYDHAVSVNRSKAKEFLSRYRNGTAAPVEKGAAAASAEDYRYVRLNDHSLEVREGEGLTMTFNFWTQQLIIRDTERPSPAVVQNFDAIQRQDSIAEAYQKLKALGGNPPEPRAASVAKKPALS